MKTTVIKIFINKSVVDKIIVLNLDLINDDKNSVSEKLYPEAVAAISQCVK